MLKAENITKTYNGRKVLNEVSLEIRSEIKALIGVNGSGKSTFLKIVAGIVVPDKGRVLFSDGDVTEKPPEQRNFGYVPQHPALFQHLTVEDNIRYGLRNGRGSEESFRKAVELLDLKEELKKKPRELSGGYQSRTSLARALVSQPRVILLDEPLSGMDVALKDKILPEFRIALKAADVPVLFVTHDAGEAEIVADSFAVIKDGVVRELDNSEEAFKFMSTSN
ncbi:MAG: ATP-binding cassette domain-containing protein [Firmicutes bacterium]|nr:ATP-binding cassette domain-containing protein [Bacillota bacterium]